jgi:transposase-like protein
MKVNQLPDSLKLQVVQEYLSTGVSQRELQRKYHFGGSENINRWIRKFGFEVPDNEQLETTLIMRKEAEKTAHELELEARVRKLEEELRYEKFRTLALNTLIDVAERDLKITIRKKPGAKQ